MWTEREQLVSHAVVFKKPSGSRFLVNLSMISAVAEFQNEVFIVLQGDLQYQVDHTFDEVMSMMRVTLKKE